MSTSHSVANASAWRSCSRPVSSDLVAAAAVVAALHGSMCFWSEEIEKSAREQFV